MKNIKYKLNILLVFSFLFTLLVSPAAAKDKDESTNYLISLDKQPLSLKGNSGNFSLTFLTPYLPYPPTQERTPPENLKITSFSLSANIDGTFSQVKDLSLSSEKINKDRKISSFPAESPPSSPKLDNSLFAVSLISYTILNAADYFSTREALKYSGVREANPLLKSLAKNDIAFAALKLGFTASNVYLLQKLHQKNKTLAWVISGLCNAALSYVVINNLKVINKVNH